MSKFPVLLGGIVCKGFGRGSRELGIPTANLPESEVERLDPSFDLGVYYGWAQVHQQVYKMVMSIGWNPFYKNEKKTAEVHILHNFTSDFYGEEMKVVIVGYIRPERDFKSLDVLIAEINNDIAIATQELDKPANAALKSHPFFNPVAKQ